MESSRCKAPQFGANGSSADEGWEKVIISFGSLGLREDRTLVSQPSLIRSTNVISSAAYASDNKLAATTREKENCMYEPDGGYRNIRFSPVMGSHVPDGNHMMSGYRNFSPFMCSQFCDPTCFPYQVSQNSSLQPDRDFLTMARTPGGSKQLQEDLEQGNYYKTQEILNRILGSIFELMIDDNGHHAFAMLVEKCRDDQLFLIVRKIHSDPDTFIFVAFTDKGSKSIQRLIKRLKRSPMAEIITEILSRKSYELLTHKTGSYAIRQCFVILGEEPNLILYRAISSHLLALAIDSVGCISLNHLIDTITGQPRELVLIYLAEHSLFLSNDPSGNFVVQHLLNLNNERVTTTILGCLRGNFEQLSLKQGGSHVVEKCIRSSKLGLNLVVSEIFKDGKVLFRLAQDQFGNYAIQTSLKRTKIISEKNLYPVLLKALRPYYYDLLRKTWGRYVAELIRDDLGLKQV